MKNNVYCLVVNQIDINEIIDSLGFGQYHGKF